MKQIICEMCGSNSLVKQEGLFVCQACQTKYTTEEARKMMIEGTVDITGTVKIDSSEKIRNLYTIARRARDDYNTENAAKYYSMITIEDPDSWEAAFYSVFFQAQQCTIAEIKNATNLVYNCISSVLELVISNVIEEGDQEEAFLEITLRVIEISNNLFSAAKNSFFSLEPSLRNFYTNDYQVRTDAIFDLLYDFGDVLSEYAATKGFAKSLAVKAWKEGIRLSEDYISSYSLLTVNELANIDINIMKRGYQKIHDEIAEEIRKYEPSYSQSNLVKSKSFSGCYIATAVYGSYNCYQVCTLRRYRDYTLSQKWYGQVFIKTYYFISPKLVDLFGEKQWFIRFFKHFLDILVVKLQENGI